MKMLRNLKNGTGTVKRLFNVIDVSIETIANRLPHIELTFDSYKYFPGEDKDGKESSLKWAEKLTSQKLFSTIKGVLTSDNLTDREIMMAALNDSSLVRNDDYAESIDEDRVIKVLFLSEALANFATLILLMTTKISHCVVKNNQNLRLFE